MLVWIYPCEKKFVLRRNIRFSKGQILEEAIQQNHFMYSLIMFLTYHTLILSDLKAALMTTVRKIITK